jgi:hypothetical protein
MKKYKVIDLQETGFMEDTHVMAGVAGSEGAKGIHKVFDLMHAKYGTRDLVKIMTHIQESGIHSAMNMHMGTDINKQDVKQFGEFIGKGLKGKSLGISVSMKVRGRKTIIKVKNLPSFMGKDMCKSFEAWIEQWLKQRLSNINGSVSVDKVSKE